MTYCSEIMHQQTQKISELEAEIQQLKDERQKQYKIDAKLFKEQHIQIENLKEQVEAAKTILKNNFTYLVIGSIEEQLWKALEGETTK